LITTFSLVLVLVQELLSPVQELLCPGQALLPCPVQVLRVLRLSLVPAPARGPVSPLLSERASPALEPGRTRSKKNLQKRK
jgi:hypothetical protein